MMGLDEYTDEELVEHIHQSRSTASLLLRQSLLARKRRRALQRELRRRRRVQRRSANMDKTS